MNKGIFFVLLFFLSLVGKAQFQSLTVGIDGLTCSMCSNTVERSLLKLEFVKSVKMDLNENVALISLKEGKQVNIYEVGKQVNDAGYTVRFIKAIFHFGGLQVQSHSVFPFEGSEYIFLHISPTLLDGDKEITFIDKKIIARKEYPRWEAIIDEDRKINKTGKNTYHVTW